MKIKNVLLNEQCPKICVSVTGCRKEDIVEELELVKDSCADFVEWRCDFFSEVLVFAKTLNVLNTIKEKIGNLPLVFTFRSKAEGGEMEITDEEYFCLYKKIIDSGTVDIVDVEALNRKNIIKELVCYAHKNQVFVLGSYHDFDKTPMADEIINIFKTIDSLGADILKVAFMPTRSNDLETLMTCLINVKNTIDKKPLIGISMGEQGELSRVAGGLFGSSITFGGLGNKKSAPGQIPAAELKAYLNALYCKA